ncbi:unnamed protein product [Schistosoma rodhaini]|nr:unnamed protein product [Schistosoma rodhaini]
MTRKLIPIIIYLIIHYIIIIQLIKSIPIVFSVKGCVTYVYNNNYSMRQSICDKLNTNYQIIPINLPSELIKLTINHQNINLLNMSQLIHLPNLIYLNLDSNKIKIIQLNTFKHLTKLKILSLRYNLLTISYESFHPMVINDLIQLNYINLLHNPIKSIPNRFFLPISKTIQSIIISNNLNKLILLNESFYGLYKLKLLDLSNNNLDYLPDTYELIFNQMQLNELYLYGNPWKCDCHLKWLIKWFIKYNKKLIYYKSINDIILNNNNDNNNIDLDINYWLINEQKNNKQIDMNTILQPKCATPIKLHGKPLFNPIINNNNHNNNHNDTQMIRTVDFYCSPESYTPNQQIQFIRGNNSTLSCKFFADPTGIVIWYKDGIRIQNHWPRLITKQTQGRNFLAELTIENIQNSDAGIYVCYLDTGYGNVNTTFHVQVDGGTSMDETFYHNGVFYWISKLDTTLVLKYTGMIAACLIILLVIMGLLIYLFNGKMYCRPKLCINKTVPTYDNRSDQFKQGLGGESDTINTSNFSTLSDKNTITNSKSTYTLQGQNLNLCTPLGPKNENIAMTCKRSPTYELDDHVYLHCTSSNVLDQHNLLSHKSRDPTFDNYVTVRLLPTVTGSELTVPCPIHNYAFIHQVSTDPTTVSAANNVDINYDGVVTGSMQVIPESHLSSSNIKKYNPIENSNLTTSVSNMKISSTSEENVALKTHKVVSTDSGNINNKITSNIDNNCLNSSDYKPCPLHGNIYATLQSKDKKNISAEIRKHIASVPPGLTGLNYDKHHTLPNKKFRTQLSTSTTNMTITCPNSTSDILRTNTTYTTNSVTDSLMDK